MTENKVKICHFSSAHPSTDVRVFHKECSSLSSAGFDVHLVVANEGDSEKNGVRVHGVVSEGNSRIFRFVKTSRSVYKKALEIDATIYHFHDPELLPFALKLKRKGKRVIYDIHEDVPKTILAKFWINKYLRKSVSFCFRKYENYVASKLDFLFTATETISKRFILVNKNTITINNYPLLSELVEVTNWESKKREVCYIGAITKIRGIEELVEGVYKSNDVILNLAGAFDQLTFEQHLKSLPSWKSVNDFGLVDRSATRSIMQDSKIGMVTFLPVPNHVDAQPNKMFEYMSAGIPVVGSFFPLWKDILEVNKCGICIDPENSDEIAKAIDLLLNDDVLAKQMGENGRKAVIEKYNWSVEEEKLIHIYRQLS